MKKALVLYWSNTGNTEKVAVHIKAGLEESGIQTALMRIEPQCDVDFFDYDLVCLGVPSYSWSPPKPADDFLKNRFNYYKKEGKIKTSCPKVPGKDALIFCTFSGPHTGIREAEPVGKYIGQYFEHLGFTVQDEWYILSEFHGSEELSTKGRMGNIIGLPSKEDLLRVKTMAINLAQRL